MLVDVIFIFVLLVLFQIKHLVIDFIVQLNDASSIKKFNCKGWFFPLLRHAGDHAIGTAIIALIVFSFYSGTLSLWCVFWAIKLGLLDLIIHFTMDRIKASPYMLGKFKYPSKEYFYSLGVDQTVHHLTHYLLIAILYALTH